MTIGDRRFTPAEAAAIRADHEAGILTRAALCRKWDCGVHTLRRVINRDGCYSEEGERALRQTEAG